MLTYETIEDASLRSLVNDYKNGCPMFSGLLRNDNGYSDSVNKNAEFSVVRSEFSDVFAKELPKGLPPNQPNEEFEIELKDGDKPIKKDLYRTPPC